jgi:hypothetical protein
MNHMSRSIENTIKRVGGRYLDASKPLKITIGQILAGKLKLKEVREKVKD